MSKKVNKSLIDLVEAIDAMPNADKVIKEINKQGRGDAYNRALLVVAEHCGK